MLSSILDKKFLLSELPNLDFSEQEEILERLSPEDFSDIIYVFPFYFQNKKFHYQLLDKLKQIKNWKVYFDHNPPEEMIDLFFTLADDNMNSMDQALYYLYHFKVPLHILKKHFLKIYDYAIQEYDDDPRKMRKESTLFNGIFVAYTKEQLQSVIDFLLDQLERYDGNHKLDNPYSEVLLILIAYARTLDRLYKHQIFTPMRLERLYQLL